MSRRSSSGMPFHAPTLVREQVTEESSVSEVQKDAHVVVVVPWHETKQTNLSSLLLNHADSATTITTTINTALYRDNGKAILPFKVDVNSRERSQQLIAVATALCPDLLLPSTSSSAATTLPPLSSTPLGLSVPSKWRDPENAAAADADAARDVLQQLSGEDALSSSCSDDDDEGVDEDDTAALESHFATTVELPLSQPPQQQQQQPQPQLTVRPLFGGLSNELFVVENERTGASVLVRIHPDSNNEGEGNGDSSSIASSTLDIVDRNVENELVAHLSRHHPHETPIFYGRFVNGRVEEFYARVEPLTCMEMHTYAAAIGALLGRLHTVKVPASLFAATTTTTSTVASSFDHNKMHLFQMGAIWKRVEDWCAMAQALQPPSPHTTTTTTTANEQYLVEFLQDWQTEWSWLKQAFQRHYATAAGGNDKDHDSMTPALRAQMILREVVLTHMDCQPLNLLKHSRGHSNIAQQQPQEEHLGVAGEPPLRLIDYEYAGLNPRAADIANTFCEFCNMTLLCANYETEYPSCATQDEFLLAYFRATYSLEEEKKKNQRSPHTAADTTANRILLAALRHEIGRYTVLIHLKWAVWSLVQYRNRRLRSNTTTDNGSCGGGFDYMAYAQQRMQGYHYHKCLFWNNDAR